MMTWIDFWRYQVRFRLARLLILIGLIVWPPGAAKTEVIELLWQYRRRLEREERNHHHAAY